MTLYHRVVRRNPSGSSENTKIQEAYEQILEAQKMTFLDAVKILATGGGEDEAWKLAKKDQGLGKGTTKEEWLNFAYASKAYKKLKRSK